MPIIKSAKKKLRQDKKRENQNQKSKKLVKDTILSYKRNPTPAALSKVFSVLDTAAKKNIIHKNKAARLKFRLSKMLGKKSKTDTEKVKSAIKPKTPRIKKPVSPPKT